MPEVRYQIGATLFTEGDNSDYVLHIKSGEVEVLKCVGDQSVVLGQLRAGEFVGEMGVLGDQPRSATVRATSHVVAEQIDRESFLRLVSADGEAAFNLMVRLSERLAAVDRAYAETVAGVALGESADPAPLRGTKSDATEPARLVLFAGSDQLEEALPSEGWEITEFPFVVGRRAKFGEAKPASKIQLVLADSRPYRLSRLHFWIERGHDSYWVHDRISTLGTSVNGAGIGHHFASDNAPLQRGDNTVVAGGMGSPFVFKVVLN